MAEALKVFTSGALTGADAVADKITLVTTTGSTQAVIKDVIIGAANYTAESSLILDDVEVLSTLSSAEGNLIMDNSEVLKIKLPVSTAGVFYSSYLREPDTITSTTVAYTGPSGNDGTNKSTTTVYSTLTAEAAGTTSTTSWTVPTMSNPCWIVIMPTWAYYFKHDGNSVTTLYRATVSGSTIGSWSTVDSSNYSYKCYDAENEKVYWTRSYNLYEHDCATNTTITKVTGGMESVSTYSKSCMLGDFFMFNPDTTTNEIQIVRISTGAVVAMTPVSGSLDIYPGANAAMGLAKDTTHYLFYFSDIYGDTRQYYITIDDLEAGLGAVTKGNKGQIRKGYDRGCMAGMVDGRIGMRGDDSPYRAYFVYFKAGDTISSTNDSANEVGTHGLLAHSGPTAFKFEAGGAVAASNLDISIECRVTGVEIT